MSINFTAAQIYTQYCASCGLNIPLGQEHRLRSDIGEIFLHQDCINIYIFSVNEEEEKEKVVKKVVKDNILDAQNLYISNLLKSCSCNQNICICRYDRIYEALDIECRSVSVGREWYDKFNLIDSSGQLQPQNLPQLLFARCSYVDMLKLIRLFHYVRQITDSHSVVRTNDALLARDFYRDKPDDDGEKPVPKLITCELGAQMREHGSVQNALTEMVSSCFRDTRTACWLFSVDGRFSRHSPGFSLKLGEQLHQFKSLNLISESKQPAPVPAPAPAPVPAPAPATIEVAFSRGTCVNCSGLIEPNTQFVWVGHLKKAHYPSCSRK